MPWTSTYQGSNNRFFPSSSLIPSSSYFQCLMQTVSHFSSIFFGATLNALQFPSFRQSFFLLLLSLHFLSQEMNSSIYFDCKGDEVVLRKLFITRGLYVFMARTQHAVQPEGQELTFSKCLCRRLLLVWIFQRTHSEGREGVEMTTCLIVTCILKTLWEMALF